jgi:diaminopimelate decarboxylase
MPVTVTSCPAWSISGYLEVRDGHLTIDGVDALQLVKQYHSPLFVFSEPRIRHNIARLQQ